jgi:hypothetical protein
MTRYSITLSARHWLLGDEVHDTLGKTRQNPFSFDQKRDRLGVLVEPTEPWKI